MGQKIKPKTRPIFPEAEWGFTQSNGLADLGYPKLDSSLKAHLTF